MFSKFSSNETIEFCELNGCTPRFSFPDRFPIDASMKSRVAAFAIAFVLVSTLVATAEQTATPPPAAVPSGQNAVAFDPAAATQAWLDSVPPEQRQRSDAYFEGGYWLLLWDYLMTAAIALFLLGSRISARLRDRFERFTESKALQVACYSFIFILLTYALGFPLLAYEQFYREHAYGMSNQNFGQWFGEQMIGLTIQLLLGTFLLVLLYSVFRRVPRTWWLWGTALAVAILPVLFVLSPIFVEPLFNTYKPLSDPRINEQILAMAHANQIPVTQVFEVDASRQTKRISANVAGFLGTTRIALNDNLLKQCTLPEIREVMAHEMGHYVLNHTMKTLFQLAVLIFILFAVMRAAFDAAVRRWGERWGARGIGDPAGLPLLVLIFATVSFLATPLTNTITRVTEREADAFAMNTAREPDGTAKIALKLGAYRKLNPGPIEEFVFFDHPSGRARIRMAMDWKAAQLTCGEVNPER